MSKFINKAADGGITALHMAALNGYYDCVHLLLDLHANVLAVTFHYGTSMDLIGNSNSLKFLLLNLNGVLSSFNSLTNGDVIIIGAGSTPLHYAACGGNLKCCQARRLYDFNSLFLALMNDI